MKTLLMLALLMPVVASAATLYKSVTPDGRIIYSDQPPQTGKVEKTFSFANLPATPVPDANALNKDGTGNSAQKPSAASSRQPVLFMAKWCGYCRQAEAYLGEKKISYQRHDIDTPEGRRAFAEAGGSRGVPVMLAAGQRVQGYSRPAYDALFAAGR